MSVRAARGAIVVSEDTVDAVLSATQRVLEAILTQNDIVVDDLISILFTATEDLTSAFPAEGARRLGLGSVPLLCAREIAVEGAMKSVVRVLMHFHSDRGLDQI